MNHFRSRRSGDKQGSDATDCLRTLNLAAMQMGRDPRAIRPCSRLMTAVGISAARKLATLRRRKLRFDGRIAMSTAGKSYEAWKESLKQAEASGEDPWSEECGEAS